MLLQSKSLIPGVVACLLAFLMVQPQSANAVPITYDFSGTYSSLLAGSDTLGLVGSTFTYTSTYDREPGSCYVDSESAGCSYFSGTSSLTLSGTAGGIYDGTYSVLFNDQSVVVDMFSTFFGSTSFLVGGLNLQIINRIAFDASLFSGPEFLLPILNTADITAGSGEGRIEDVVYGISGFAATTSVPEPSTVVVLLLGLACLRGSGKWKRIS